MQQNKLYFIEIVFEIGKKVRVDLLRKFGLLVEKVDWLISEGARRT